MQRKNRQEAACGSEVATASIGEVRQAASDTSSAAAEVLSPAHEPAHYSAGLGQEVDRFLSGIKAQ
jgi:methyl-accepting chemotaxis protein